MTTQPTGPKRISGSGIFNAKEKVAADSWAAGLAHPPYNASVQEYELAKPLAPGQELIVGYLVQWSQTLVEGKPIPPKRKRK